MAEDLERKQIKSLLNKRFTINELQRLLSAASQDWESVVAQNADKLTAIMDILQDAERNSWLPDLLQAMIEDFEARLASPAKEAEVARVREIESRLRARWGRGTALDDPFKSCFVRGGWPFVNRPQISKAFARLAEPTGFRVAVINGNSGTGKTYSKELPQFVAAIQSNQHFSVYYKDLSEGNYAITAEQLVQSILRFWNEDVPIPAQMSQSSSYATELSEWLAAKAPSDPTSWIIIDGLAKIKPDPSLPNFLMALARHIVDSPHNLRLVLLDLGDETPFPPSAELLTTKVKINEITSNDLVEHYFKMLHQAQATATPFDSTLMSNKAQEIIDQILSQAGNGKPFDRLKDVLLQVTEELGFS